MKLTVNPPYIHFFGDNKDGRDYIVGDIHGAFTRLDSELSRIGFDRKTDRLFCVGDLVDRGPESAMYGEWLQEPWFFTVQGNHEAMAVAFEAGELRADSYEYNGGGWNVFNSKQKQREVAVDFLSLPVAIQLATPKGVVGIVHADTPYKSWLDTVKRLQQEGFDGAFSLEKIISFCQWSRTRYNAFSLEGVRDCRAIICGHTVTDSPVTLGNVMYIETGGWKGVPDGTRKFTILDAETLEVM